MLGNYTVGKEMSFKTLCKLGTNYYIFKINFFKKKFFQEYNQTEKSLRGVVETTRLVPRS